MAGAIRLNENEGWSVATWVFYHVLRVSCPYLPEEGSSRIVALIGEVKPGLNYLNLDGLSESELAIFRGALERGYQHMLGAGKQEFADPDFYPGFMDRFKELLDLMSKGSEL